MKKQFLPTTKQEMDERKIEQLDFVYVTGDAYVDHPSFGHAIISRVLESHCYTVGIIPQPDWRHVESVKVLGRPRLGFLVTSGSILPGNDDKTEYLKSEENFNSLIENMLKNAEPSMEDSAFWFLGIGLPAWQSVDCLKD